MVVELSIPLKPMSVNAYTYGSKKFKTKEAREYEQVFGDYLNNYESKLKELKDEWEREYRTFKVTVVVTHPDSIFLNNDGRVSSKTFDVDNVLKPILDMIFRHMEINDKNVIKLVSEKVSGDDWLISVTLELNPNS